MMLCLWKWNTLIEINDEMTNQLFDRQAKVRDNLRFSAFASARFIASL